MSTVGQGYNIGVSRNYGSTGDWKCIYLTTGVEYVGVVGLTRHINILEFLVIEWENGVERPDNQQSIRIRTMGIQVRDLQSSVN